MKSYLYIIIITLLFSCKTSDKDTIILLDETIERLNSNWEAFSYSPSANIYNKYAIYPDKLQSVKDITDKINQKHRKIQLEFERIREKNNVIYENEDRSFVFNHVDGDTKELFKKIEDYKQYISKAIADSLIILSALEFLDIERYNSSNIKYTELNLLINKVNYYNTLVLYALAELVIMKKYVFTKYKPVVIPQKNILKPGEYYEAEIYLAIIDTTAEYKVIINNKVFKPQNGIVNYKKFASKVGTITENGSLNMKKPGSSTELNSFLFEIEYKVIYK